MKLQILSNLNYPIGNVINQELSNSIQARIAVAFMKYSGLKVIENSLQNCLDKKGNVEIIAGLDFKTTDPQAIKFLITLKKSNPSLSFFCFGDKKDNGTNIVFHPKIYLFNKKKETTSIIGSTNLTGGGLLSNFEVNTIITEDKPLYFSQLEAIYNSVKFTPTIFEPDQEYLDGYSDVYSAFFKNEEKARKDKGVIKVIAEIEKKEMELPGTIPSLKKLIIEFIKEQLSKGANAVALGNIYSEMVKVVMANNYNFKMDTFRNTVRGELNKHETESKHQDNLNLFIRTGKGLYSLTDKAKNYNGR